MSATVDMLGEHTKNQDVAKKITDQYCEIFQKINVFVAGKRLLPWFKPFCCASSQAIQNSSEKCADSAEQNDHVQTAQLSPQDLMCHQDGRSGSQAARRV